MSSGWFRAMFSRFERTSSAHSVADKFETFVDSTYSDGGESSARFCVDDCRSRDVVVAMFAE